MAETIAVLQRKGGVGKSTLICSFAYHLSRQGARVLVVDTDRQGTCMRYHDLAQTTEFNIVTAFDDARLRAVLERYGPEHDVVLIDTPGVESRLTSYVAAASDLVLIPASPSLPDAEGAASTWELVQRVREANNRRPKKALVVLSKFVPTARVTASIAKSMRDAGLPLYPWGMQELTGFKEMFSTGVPVGVSHQASLRLLTSLQLDGHISWEARTHEVA